MSLLLAWLIDFCKHFQEKDLFLARWSTQVSFLTCYAFLPLKLFSLRILQQTIFIAQKQNSFETLFNNISHKAEV